MRNKKIYSLSVVLLLGIRLGFAQLADYNITPVPFNKVHITDQFWAKRIKTNKDVTIPIAFSHCESTGRIDNFKIAGKLMPGKFKSESPFDDSDVSKIIEGAAYALSSEKDPKLEAYVDSVISYMKAAQEDDGYLYTYRTIMGDDSHPWIGSKRWEKTHILSHELYNLGHMFEAGVAYYEATGKQELINVCKKAADLLCKDFGWNAFKSYPGHQEVEIGLVKLYRITGEKKYLDLAKFFLDVRGKCDFPGDTYSQSHQPVVEQDEAVGHSVRALYMYTAMADVAALTGDMSYIAASKKLWEDIAKTKLYITGGVGAAGGHEGFGGKYELPNLHAYCETCAAIANVFWNQRLFLMEGDSKYIDVLERSLYNNVLSGVAVTGDRFFYPNPLESNYGGRRSAWFGCACCPSNISRFIPAVPGYIYGVKGDELYVNLFISNSSSLNVGKQKVSITQSGNMPWEGNTDIIINPAKNATFTVKVRIPGWAINEAAPDNELYWFKGQNSKSAVVKVNGVAVDMTLNKGYVAISRQWKKGDKISVELPMDVQRIACNPKVSANIGKTALQRGPIVYCSEGIDFADSRILDMVLPDTAAITCLNDTLLKGMVTLHAKAYQTKRDAKGETQLADRIDLKAIPYYAWAHRKASPMVMWYATNKYVAKPRPAATIANLSRVDGSVNNVSIEAIRDQLLPSGSNDNNLPFFHWWPHSNQTEWVSYTFDKPYTISKSKIFWFNDGGGCKAPQRWRLYYDDNGQWKEVKTKNEYGIQLNIINTTDFEPITTKAVKIEIDLPKDCASGIHEWIIE